MSKEIITFEFEVRAELNEDHGHYLVGNPIVYGAQSEIIDKRRGRFLEIIEEGALAETDLRDVRFLINHNTEMIPLARSRNNNENSTMQMRVVPGVGMEIRVDLDVENNADARSLYSAVERGDISGMSFMMGAVKDKWEDTNTEMPKRYVRSIGRVYEVSAVTFPAYIESSIQTRGLSDALDSAWKSLDSAKAEIERIERQKQKIRILTKEF